MGDLVGGEGVQRVEEGKAGQKSGVESLGEGEGGFWGNRAEKVSDAAYAAEFK